MPVKLDGLHDALLRYKIPEKMGRFEGHVDWVKNERVLTLMRSFRRAVIKKDSQFVRTVLGALQSATHVGVISFRFMHCDKSAKGCHSDLTICNLTTVSKICLVS